MEQSDSYLKNKEAADYLKVSISTLDIWRKHLPQGGHLPSFKVGRQVRFLKSDLDAFLARCKLGGVVYQEIDCDEEL